MWRPLEISFVKSNIGSRLISLSLCLSVTVTSTFLDKTALTDLNQLRKPYGEISKASKDRTRGRLYN